MLQPVVEIMLRRLGNSELTVLPIAFGGWPIAGVSTLDTTNADSLETIRACFDVRINHIDTAHVYGPHGESERLIGQAIADRRDEVVLATKCGIHYEGDAMVNDARPDTLRAECETSLKRLGTDRVELLYLHAPDEKVPIAESAGALKELLDAGKARTIGVCNANVEQLEEFQAACPITAVQLPFNMLQRDIEARIVPWCARRNIAVVVYWVLMKGLLAGKLKRDHQFAERDSRRKYPMYQGGEWHKNQDFVDELRRVADGCGCTVSQLVINWTIHQPGITVALCGAKRRWQIEESAGAMGWEMTAEQQVAVDRAITQRGPAVGKRVVS
jgi:aryl-alcohol dehydrogenase-like predicted oxidoreductase